MSFENKNEKQFNFNQIKGIVTEINAGEIFSSITLTVGHETKRYINVVFKTTILESIKEKIQIEDKVSVKYYLASYNNFSKWKTLAHLLFIDKIHIIA
jgi:hypothetical protein